MNLNIIRIALWLVTFILVAVYFYFLNGNQMIFGFQFDGQEIPAWHAGAAFFSTFLGVIFSIFIQNYRNNIVYMGWKEFFKSLLKFTTPGSFIVSALVYIFAFQSIYTSVGDLIAYFSAFQSGFFFKQTLVCLEQSQNDKETEQ